MSSHKVVSFILLATLLTFAFVLVPSQPAPVAASEDPGVIAYVRPNNESGDEIHLVAPDGNQDRHVYSTGRADSEIEDIFAISSLAWRPDGGELAFASDHEYDCSFLQRDIYSIRPDGSGYRRITQAPACAELADYPQGSVTVPVENNTYSFLFIYIQGAREFTFINASPSNSVTFYEVADLGAGTQFAIADDGTYRSFNLSGAEVQAGTHVTAQPALVVGSSGLAEFGADWPSWHNNGSKLGFVLGMGDLRQISAQPGPLEIGDLLLASGVSPMQFADHLAWSPLPTNEFLYRGWDVSGDETIYLGVEDGSDAGQPLVIIPASDRVEGLAWLPDGSGFVYSRTEQNAYYEIVKANIFRYSFETEQSVAVTDFTHQFTGRLSVSPDGNQIVFELAESYDYDGMGPRDLWIVDMDGSDAHLLMADAQAPAWGPSYVSESVHAEFVAKPTSGMRPLLVQFTNQSTGDYDTCTWTFGDGGTSSSCSNPTHTYATEGVYTVALTVTGPGGADTLTRTGSITVYEPVQAVFTGSPTAGRPPLIATFTNQSTGDYDTCAWTFGDGESSSSCSNPTHTYATEGVYTVALTISGLGGTDTQTRAQYITVQDEYRAYLPLTLRAP
jgi:TolB protein